MKSFSKVKKQKVKEGYLMKRKKKKLGVESRSFFRLYLKEVKRIIIISSVRVR